jgi:hypothetical protein
LSTVRELQRTFQESQGAETPSKVKNALLLSSMRCSEDVALEQNCSQNLDHSHSSETGQHVRATSHVSGVARR